MQITFLGTGTGLPNRERAPSGLLVQLGQYGHLALQPWTRPARYEIIRHLAETSPYSPASSPETGPGWTVSTARTDHSLYSLGYRLESEGKVMAYSGDAKDCAELVELGRGAGASRSWKELALRSRAVER